MPMGAHVNSQNLSTVSLTLSAEWEMMFTNDLQSVTVHGDLINLNLIQFTADIGLVQMVTLSTRRPCTCVRCFLTRGGARNFHLGAVAQGIWGRKFPSGVQGWSPTTGSGAWSWSSLQTFWPQKLSKFENFAQFTYWFLTSMFHDGC